MIVGLFARVLSGSCFCDSKPPFSQKRYRRGNYTVFPPEGQTGEIFESLLGASAWDTKWSAQFCLFQACPQIRLFFSLLDLGGGQIYINTRKWRIFHSREVSPLSLFCQLPPTSLDTYSDGIWCLFTAQPIHLTSLKIGLWLGKNTQYWTEITSLGLLGVIGCKGIAE